MNPSDRKQGFETSSTSLILFFDIYYVLQPKAEVADRVERGYRMESPDGCPQSVYAIMRVSWDRNENNRPTFREIRKKLELVCKELEVNAAKQEN